MAELHERPRKTPAGEFRLRVYLFEKVDTTDGAGNPVVEYVQQARTAKGYIRTLLTKELHQLSGQSEQHRTSEVGVKWTGYDIQPGWRIEIRYRGSRPTVTYHVQTVEDYDGRGLIQRLRVSPVDGK